MRWTHYGPVELPTRELHLSLSEKELQLKAPRLSPRSTWLHSVSGLVAIGLHLYCTRWQRSAVEQARSHKGGGLTCVSLNNEVERLRGSPTRRAERAASNVLPAHSSQSTPAAPAQTPQTLSRRRLPNPKNSTGFLDCVRGTISDPTRYRVPDTRYPYRPKNPF